MSFVVSEDPTMGVGIPQYALRHIETGQKMEVTFKIYPGKIFPATVDELTLVSSQGQLQPSGQVMSAPGESQSTVPFGVRFRLDDGAELDSSKFPGGAVGTAAIYTEKVRATHVIRRVMIRMDAWLNYIRPFLIFRPKTPMR